LPAADVQYVLDGSLEAGHISGDTHFYLMEIATNANEVVDAHDQQARLDQGAPESHWQSLTRMGLYFEAEYVRWRADRPADAKMASLQGLRHLPETFREFSRTCASVMAENGHRTLSRDAIALLDRKFEFQTTKQIMRRTMQRASCDFADSSPEELADVKMLVEGRYQENRRAHDEAIQRLRENMTTQINNAYYNIVTIGTATNTTINTRWVTTTSGTNTVYMHGAGGGLYRQPDEREIRRTQRMIRERKEAERRVLKRSIKFLSKLVGNETTRMFIGGEGIRFEGQHAIYELKKMSNLMSSHGGFRALSVYHKEHPDLLLCNICIYTNDVPLLDHVASLVLHIQAGNEEEILKIGNAREVHESAYELEWLAPHLPKPFDRDGAGINWDLPRLFEREESPTYRRNRERIERETIRLRPIVARHIYDEVLADFVPLIRAAGLQFRTEHDRPVWNGTAIGTVNTINNANVALDLERAFPAVEPQALDLEAAWVD